MRMSRPAPRLSFLILLALAVSGPRAGFGQNPGAATQLPAGVAQERVELDVVERIRDEGLNRSRIEDLARHLTDVIGPRLTGSTGMRAANEWTAQTFRDWGLHNVVIEPWGEFGRGWERVSYFGRITEPFVQPLNAQPMAWTGSTTGLATGPVVAVEAVTPQDLARFSGRLRGVWILTQPHVGHEPEFEPYTRRFDAETLLTPPPPPPTFTPQQARQQFAQQGPSVQAVLDSMARAEGALGYLRPSQWAYGILRVGSGGSRDPTQPEALPTLLVSADQYGQLWRNAVNGVAARVELNVRNRFFSDDLQAYNTLADLPGSDRADEYVMLGAHLDSWHWARARRTTRPARSS
jgi:carboxypeptidase Q